jgi:hypothetical protein
MDDSVCLPESVQRRGCVDWRRIEIEADRSESVGTMHEDISQPHPLWVPR